MKLLLFGNSAVNVVIYPLRDKDYRRTFAAMISLIKCRGQKHHHHPENEAPALVSLTRFVDLNAKPSESFQQTSSLLANEESATED